MIRGTTVSAEHVSSQAEPLNLKEFIYELDVPVIVGGAAGYTPALHLMRTGAAGVIVGAGVTTNAETVGIEGRWGYFDQAGQLRASSRALSRPPG